MEVSLRDVSVRFGESLPALDGVSLEVASGERLAVVGSSGAGKSTLFRTLTRGVPATGEVVLGGRDLYRLGSRELRAVRRRVGTVRQGYDLVPQLPAGMNVALGELVGLGPLASLAAFFRGPGAGISRRAAEALGRVGMPEKILARTGDLSGGQQQRVAVARLLVQRPDLVLADEPFSAVDPVTSEKVFETLLDLNREGATLIVNLHDVALARRFPRLVALKDGRVAYDGPPQVLTESRLAGIYSTDPARLPANGDGKDARTRSGTPLPGGLDGVASH
ncbi:phosphonate transport system ATP-binding protein [Rubrobacter radiotolerans DSM 5868]|uniref:ATP-binding cassette domain-containing protein n=1 Tax=Rubrobacter radiotolerans TaxID=42256 RepID=A0AB35T1I5_RUBRA|nr:ATP-binding cassette domain-containing protein [Rubrobacter radiotolerans]MDX5893709.1 ATP-binding cassette domain-containing protein [Rubrobacter radiotolerans]SMC04331.1 phosphonate transport system ATP-binding protein [Rubrobacter radiotolerans DSM 5868]